MYKFSVIVGNNISDLTGSFSAGAGGNAGGCAISAGIKNIVAIIKHIAAIIEKNEKYAKKMKNMQK